LERNCTAGGEGMTKELEKYAIDVIKHHSHQLVKDFTETDLINRELTIFNAGYHKANDWHYPSKGDLPQCDENTQLIFYVKDWNEIRFDYYYHFALGFYRPAFLVDGEKMFVEENKGYSCEHSPKYVIMWKELVPPEVRL
jgi:hypothetical protein